MPPPIRASAYDPIGVGVGDMSVRMRPDSRTGVLLSAKERREVLGRLGEALYDRSEEIGGKVQHDEVYTREEGI